MGAVLSIALGLVWAGLAISYAVDATERTSTVDLDLSPTGVLIVAGPPCLAWILGGWLTWQGLRGWRWAPIVASALFAAVLIRADGHGLAWTVNLVANIAVALLLLLPARPTRVSLS